MATSVYHPIKSSTGEIRLLSIQPAGSLVDPIICRLHPQLLSQNPQYEALSYTWDKKKSEPKFITLNGESFTVQENVERAIRRLRQRKTPRTVWIDAICINQNDTDERNCQVLLMRDIYSKAQQVCIWLGEPTEGGKLAIDLLNGNNFTIGWHQWMIDRKHGKPALPWLQTLGNSVSVQNRTHLIQEQNTGEVREFLDRPWWKRVWIVQEVVLARNIVVMCGADMVPWDKIDEATARYTRRFGRASSPFGIHSMSDVVFNDDRYYTLRSLRQSWALSSNSLSLYDTLYRFRELQCSNPRDRIYGFLGIIPSEIAQSITPNYHVSTAKVYRQFARKIIEMTATLDILNCKREWHSGGDSKLADQAYNLLDQAKYHDVQARLDDGPDQKLRYGWARLPLGWERRVQQGKNSCYFIDHNTEKPSQTSPLEALKPAKAQSIPNQRRLPKGWVKDWDNLGRVSVEYCKPLTTAPAATKVRDDDLAGLEQNPSWVPCWAFPMEKDPYPLLDWTTNGPSYWAMGKNKFVNLGSVGLDDSELCLSGILFDEIKVIGAAWHPTSRAPPISRRGIPILEQWETLALAPRADCPYNGERSEALWRTMIADYAGDRSAPAEDWSMVEVWNDRVGWGEEPPETHSMGIHQTMKAQGAYGEQELKMFRHHEEINPATDSPTGFRDALRWAAARPGVLQKKYRKYLRKIHRACAHRALFVTARGYLGLAPWNARAGDKVAVLEGGKTPFLLRPASADAYTLVGEAFVYGIMGGEAWGWEHGMLAARMFRII
ncbi:hypothetical protein AUP68_04444 [Ilyonectria robusta]